MYDNCHEGMSIAWSPGIERECKVWGVLLHKFLSTSIHELARKLTLNISRKPSTISCFISMMRSQTPFRVGILRLPCEFRWAYSRSSRNSGSSTTENGWSQAATHLATRVSKWAWSHGSYRKVTSTKSKKASKRTLFLVSCCSNISQTFLEMVSSSFRYFLTVTSSIFFLPLAMSISSLVGGPLRLTRTS